ncbi:MAG: YraN family protein [bacterium]|nr:YraN family protein [bacterium]
MKSESRKFGDIGEEVAKEFLVKLGYSILGLNYAKRYGEIDIIAEKNNILVFCEVKTSLYFCETSFTPEIRVDGHKKRNLIKTCETYIFENKLPIDKEWQIDVISVILNQDNSIHDINHIENAVFGKKY